MKISNPKCALLTTLMLAILVAFPSISSSAQTSSKIRTQKVTAKSSTQGKNPCYGKITIDMPLNGNAALKTAIFNFCKQQLRQSCYNAKKASTNYTGAKGNFQALANFYARKYRLEMQPYWREAHRGGFNAEFYREVTISKVADTDDFVSYEVSWSDYDGGAHPNYGIQGYTFSKTDGHRITYTLTDEKWDRMQPRVKRAIAESRDASSFSEISEFISLNDDGTVPKPGAKPYFTSDGIKLVWQPYEIGPFRLGLVAITLPIQSQSSRSHTSTSARTVVTNGKVYTSVERMPVFPGGDAALLQFVATHLQYPAEAAKNGIQGRVILQFVVTAAGEVGEVKVLRSLSADCDKEAIRVVKSLPTFTPGYQNGEPVNVWYTFPVTFRLQN